MKLKASIKRRKLPPAPEPTRAYCSRVVVGDISSHLEVVDVEGYVPKPSPIPHKRETVKEVKRPKKTRKLAGTYMYDRQEWTEERINRLIELYESGLSFDDIGFQMQCSGDCASTMICNLRAKGLVKSKRIVYGWSDKQNNDLINAYRRGATYDEMSRITGKSTSVCWYQIRKLLGTEGVEGRERGRKQQ